MTCVARKVFSCEYLFETGFDARRIAHQPEVQIKKFANSPFSKRWTSDRNSLAEIPPVLLLLLFPLFKGEYTELF